MNHKPYELKNKLGAHGNFCDNGNVLCLCQTLIIGLYTFVKIHRMAYSYRKTLEKNSSVHKIHISKPGFNNNKIDFT